MIAPPYTSEFVHLFSPIIENQDITGTLRNEEGKDPVSNFIGKKDEDEVKDLVMVRGRKCVCCLQGGWVAVYLAFLF